LREAPVISGTRNNCQSFGIMRQSEMLHKGTPGSVKVVSCRF